MAVKRTSLFVSIALSGLLTAWDAPFKQINPALVQASAQELSFEQKIELITKTKDQVGSGDQLRRFFFGDLEPISVQPGGAGMLVNLYNKANDITFAYCATYDVVIAIKKGKITKFNPDEIH